MWVLRIEIWSKNNHEGILDLERENDAEFLVLLVAVDNQASSSGKLTDAYGFSELELWYTMILCSRRETLEREKSDSNFE